MKINVIDSTIKLLFSYESRQLIKLKSTHERQISCKLFKKHFAFVD